MKITVFYSWQSDKHRATNQDFIQEAARRALERLAAQEELEIEPVLDRDTQDVPGAPVIAEAILGKIDRCGIFLSDITLITERGASRAAPNPNVLIELGYAMARVGWDRIVHVMNVYYGGASRLPFDLKHRRWPTDYNLSPDANGERIAAEKERLADDLKLAFRSIVQSGVLIPTIHPKDRRVALNFARELNHFTGIFAVFLANNAFPDAMKIVGEDYEDEPGGKYPPAALVEPILEAMSRVNFNAPSIESIGDNWLSWSAMLARYMHELWQGCEKILNQYADRDDTLIALIDEMSKRAENLARMFSTAAGAPQIAELYEKGLPAGYVDHVRYFLLLLLKSYRVTREFGVMAE